VRDLLISQSDLPKIKNMLSSLKDIKINFHFEIYNNLREINAMLYFFGWGFNKVFVKLGIGRS